MPSNKYLKLKIDNQELDFDIDDDFPVKFSYQLEDTQDFQRKKSSENLGLKIPATLNNQKILNTFQNNSYEDTTEFRNFRNFRKISAEANGVEIFNGKAISKRAISQGGNIKSYELNCFGNNANWIIDLKELTFFEILNHLTFLWDYSTIENSWQFDGTNESVPYVFAPVKYGLPMDPDNNNNENYSINSMKPSLSVYWILVWGFQKGGFKIKSDFINSDYFRRLVMPWTFGAFLTSEGTKFEIHKFLAKSDVDHIFSGDTNTYVDLNVRDDFLGCFDNNNTVVGGNYYGNTDNGGGDTMFWKYKTPHYGSMQATFYLSIFYDYGLDLGSSFSVRVYWYKNGTQIQDDLIKSDTAPDLGSANGSETKGVYLTTSINSDDIISAKVWLYINETFLATVARCFLKVEEFKLDFFKVEIGSTIQFDSYLNLEKYKFLDFVAGLSDLFNLSIQSDSINKEVLIEPTHEYFLGSNYTQKKDGYFTKNTLNWENKQDLFKDSIVELYDNNAREFNFKFKNDSNDGILKLIQDRYKIVLASGKFVFDNRFKAEKKHFENRFFAPTMHYNVEKFKSITGIEPQMVCIIEENIANTSSKESSKVFLPKICFYKGLVTGYGGWRWNGNNKSDYPFMFSVNYKQGGQNDPILSYSDEKIGENGNFVIGVGLIKRFFLQRLVIMNNGQWMQSNFMLNNNDITNWYHRERIVIDGNSYELLTIENYDSISEESTKVILRKWCPILNKDFDRIYPSEKSVLTDAIKILGDFNIDTGTEISKIFDSQYNRLIGLTTDIS